MKKRNSKFFAQGNRVAAHDAEPPQGKEAAQDPPSTKQGRVIREIPEPARIPTCCWRCWRIIRPYSDDGSAEGFAQVDGSRPARRVSNEDDGCPICMENDRDVAEKFENISGNYLARCEQKICI